MIAALTSIASALFVCAACYCTGRIVTPGRPFPWPVRMVLGMAVLSCIFFFLLESGLGYPPAFILVGVAAIGGFAAVIGPRVGPRQISFPVPVLVMLGVYAVLYGMHALAPETGYDATGYHLGLPMEWLRNGGFPNRIGFYELLPQGMETIYGFALSLNADSVAPALVHFACLFATVALLLSVGKKLELPTWAAPCTSVVFVACPSVGVSATSAYTDIAFVLATLVTFYLVLDLWPDSSPASWALAGVAAGFCYSVKLPGLVVPAAIIIVLLIKRRLPELAGFAAGAFMIAAPWMGRALFSTWNPVAPMLNTVFRNIWFSPETDSYLRGVFQFLSPNGLREFSVLDDIAFHGSRLGLIGPIVIAAPLGLLGLWKKSVRPIALASCILFVIYTQNLSARFLLPSFLFAVLALMAVVPRKLAHTLTIVAAIASWPAVASVYSGSGVALDGWPYQAALGMESQQSYLRRTMPIYEFAEFARKHIPRDARVFDCAGLPSYYSGAVTQQFWQTSEMWSLYRILLDAMPQKARDRVGLQFASHDVRYLTLAAGPSAGVPWAADFMKEPEAWGFRLVGSVGDYRLYAVR
ncbi:glycosyltransferase family 39 protein [uncultured Paludibaculum sp.]|uniref:glycosyltransferase family 39 protein n=1 Tax=uncultured Paludibaculum sp. TaxID=1765020 RepID=UPI002AAB3F81|nr:glycosyltransferase family 39 protein [uncultured Paludibaculum sp.]